MQGKHYKDPKQEIKDDDSSFISHKKEKVNTSIDSKN
jgi:hypothetical protein